MCGDAHVWRGQVERLSDGFRCVSYDRRGHSRSPRTDAPESVETHADDAAALITALALHPVVVASSGGARIGVELARRHPELCPGLWSTLPDTDKDRYRANGDRMLAEFAGPPYELRRTDLPQVKVPALVLNGTLSHPAFPAIARALAEGLPHAHLERLDGAGHVTYAERPDEFARAVARFVTQLR